MDRERTVSAAGLQFHTAQQGDAVQAIFLHGMGGDLQTWDRLWSQLPKQVSALRYDLRGFGKTGGDIGESYSHTEDLIALMDALGVHQCDLVGVSMGGGVALHTALLYPERVRRLVLISPSLVAWEWSNDWLTYWRAVSSAARAGDMKRAKTLWWQHPLFESTRNSAAAAELYAAIQQYSGHHWLCNGEKPEYPDVDYLYQLQSPTLLLTGDKDLEDFQVIADVLTGSSEMVQRVDLLGGHLLHMEQPSQCARWVSAFFNE